jgi:hypothetical protein
MNVFKISVGIVCLIMVPGCEKVEPAKDFETRLKSLSVGMSISQVEDTLGKAQNYESLESNREVLRYVLLPIGSDGKRTKIGSIGGAQIIFENSKVVRILPILHSSPN